MGQDDTTPRSGAATLTLAVVTVLLSAGGTVACGPVMSTSRISQADAKIERARVAEAYEKSPYEFFSARYYLHKAKEEWGYSEFEAATDFAEQAKEAAESALRKSSENPWSDPVEGREKTYRMRPQNTISVDPTRVEDVTESSSGSTTDSTDAEADSPSTEDSKSDAESSDAPDGETGSSDMKGGGS